METDIVIDCTPLKLGRKKTRQQQQDRTSSRYFIKTKSCCFFGQELANRRSLTLVSMTSFTKPSFILLFSNGWRDCQAGGKFESRDK
jgi:hypothetical protein